jgi:hypothetical protein
MALIYRPCYATREEVMRELDVKLASYNSARIDRVIQSSSEDVDELCARRFYFEDATRSWDWPNYQYAYPWRVWFDRSEIADVDVNVPVVVSGGVLIDNADIFWGDPNYPTAPYTYLELNRDSSAAFGNGPTPQREIVITATYGYWINTYPAGTLAASMGSSDSTMTVSDGATPGVGDVAIIDSERMIVVDAAFTDTGISPSSGCTTASAADNTMAVPSGDAFSVDEAILLDSEWMLVQNIMGNNLTVKRAWSGSVLATHSLPSIWARRLLSVLRGQLGTVAAGHSESAPIVTSAPPALIKELTVAESVVKLTMGPSGWAAQTTANSTSASGVGGTGRTRAKEPVAGTGLQALEQRVLQAYGRQARSRVV